MGGLSWTTMFLLTKYLSIKSGKTISIFCETFTVNVLLESIFVFCILKNVFYEKSQEKAIPSFLETTIGFLSKYSFGVYLVHPLFIEEIKRVLDLDTLSFEIPIVGVLILFTVVYVLSYSASIIIRKLPFIGKYIA
jgi:surface polysaccharide O-acyltransferase-like enzyme